MTPPPLPSGPAVLGFTCFHGHPQVMGRTHQHQEMELNFITAGRMSYLAGGELVELPQRRLVLFWAAAPHQVIRVEPRTAFYCATIPFAWVLQWGLPAHFMEQLLRGELLTDAEPEPAEEERWAQWTADLPSRHVERERAALLEMEARVRRLLARGPQEASRPAAASGSRAAAFNAEPVQRMAELIARRYGDPLSVGEIAAAAGLHPNYAMTLFKKTLGLSILEYLTQHRIFHARRLLLATDRKVLDIALESGFGSLSRFYEAFEKSSGCSPGQYRKQH